MGNLILHRIDSLDSSGFTRSDPQKLRSESKPAPQALPGKTGCPQPGKIDPLSFSRFAAHRIRHSPERQKHGKQIKDSRAGIAPCNRPVKALKSLCGQKLGILSGNIKSQGTCIRFVHLHLIVGRKGNRQFLPGKLARVKAIDEKGDVLDADFIIQIVVYWVQPLQGLPVPPPDIPEENRASPGFL